jgi:hypothetical protein
VWCSVMRGKTPGELGLVRCELDLGIYVASFVSLI